MSDTKNTLVNFNPAQEDPYRADPNDFKVADAQPHPYGMAEGQNKLATLSKNQEGPRNAEGSGGTGDSMAERAAAVSSGFKVGKGASQSVPQTCSVSVDLKDGSITAGGKKPTRVGETPDPNYV